MKGGSQYKLLCIFSLLSLVILPSVEASTVVSPTDFKIFHLFPVIIAFTVAIPVWLWFIPRQLSNLQVAFEIDDDLYEVHRITRGLKDARELLRERSVTLSVGLYMMGMTGILLLITELLFDADKFYLPNLFLIAVLILIPVIVSPWETLNGQLVGRRKKSTIKTKT